MSVTHKEHWALTPQLRPLAVVSYRRIGLNARSRRAIATTRSATSRPADIRGHPSSPIWTSSSTTVTYGRFTCLTEIHEVRLRRPRRYKSRDFDTGRIKSLRAILRKELPRFNEKSSIFRMNCHGDGNFLAFVEADLNSRKLNNDDEKRKQRLKGRRTTTTEVVRNSTVRFTCHSLVFLGSWDNLVRARSSSGIVGRRRRCLVIFDRRRKPT